MIAPYYATFLFCFFIGLLTFLFFNFIANPLGKILIVERGIFKWGHAGWMKKRKILIQNKNIIAFPFINHLIINEKTKLYAYFPIVENEEINFWMGLITKDNLEFSIKLSIRFKFANDQIELLKICDNFDFRKKTIDEIVQEICMSKIQEKMKFLNFKEKMENDKREPLKSDKLLEDTISEALKEQNPLKFSFINIKKIFYSRDFVSWSLSFKKQ